MAKHKYTLEEVAEWRKTHRNIFYYNKDDTNFVIPKPYGFGKTTNWAHPASWVMAVVAAALLVYVLFFRQPPV